LAVAAGNAADSLAASAAAASARIVTAQVNIMGETVAVNLNLANALMLLSAYLAGSISPGYILVRLLRGIDLRQVRSGSLGATNVGRVLGRGGFSFTLTADLLKGALVVWMARELAFPPDIIAATAAAVIIGHIWPLWLRFHGGKGIATSLGAIAVLDFGILLAGGAVLLALYLLTRQFLLSWVATLITTPLLAGFLGFPMDRVVLLLTVAVIVLYAHRTNIRQAWCNAKQARQAKT